MPCRDRVRILYRRPDTVIGSSQGRKQCSWHPPAAAWKALDANMSSNGVTPSRHTKLALQQSPSLELEVNCFMGLFYSRYIHCIHFQRQHSRMAAFTEAWRCFMGVLHAEVSSSGVVAFFGLTAQAKPAQFESAGASARDMSLVGRGVLTTPFVGPLGH